MVAERWKIWRALNWPNRISLFRLLMIAPFVMLMLNQLDWPWARHAALGIFAMMAVSDFLDGQLARKLNARTRLGAILDPLADKALIICAVVLLSTRNYSVPDVRLPYWIVVMIVGKDLWVMLGFLVIYLVTDRFRVHPTLFGKLCTAGQLVMVVFFLLAPDINYLIDGAGRQIALILAYVVAVLCALAVISYTRLGLSYVIHEQMPLEDNKKR